MDRTSGHHSLLPEKQPHSEAANLPAVQIHANGALPTSNTLQSELWGLGMHAEDMFCWLESAVTIDS